jgi:PTS system beta-glucosides-specific IIC component
LVKKGQKLLSFDIKAIEAAGFNTQIPIIVTNTSDYGDVIPTTVQTIQSGDDLIEVL